MRKVFEYDLESGKVGFKFNMLSADYLEKEEGKSISAIFAELHESFANPQSLRMGLILSMCYAGARVYAESNGLKSPTRDSVADCIGEIDATSLYEMIASAIQMHVPKNSKAHDQKLSTQ